MLDSKLIRFSRMLIVAALCCTMVSLSSAGAANAATATSQTWMVSSGVDTPDHAIQGMVFLPGEIWIHQGDTIVWNAKSGEAHTVTFVPAGQTALPPLNTCGFTRTSLTTFDNTHFDTCVVPPPGQNVQLINSGALTYLQGGPTDPPLYTSFGLRFSVQGTFTYYCLIHHAPVTTIPGMQGIVHVVARGQPLPYTQHDYDVARVQQRDQLIAQGEQLYAQTERTATNTAVAAGISNNMVDIMRFIHMHVRIHKGQTVHFTNYSMDEPHTVTFGTVPTGQDPTLPYGDPTNFTGGLLSSGFFFSGGPSFDVTFNTVGTYSYYCILHDALGMSGTVNVIP